MEDTLVCGFDLPSLFRDVMSRFIVQWMPSVCDFVSVTSSQVDRFWLLDVAGSVFSSTANLIAALNSDRISHSSFFQGNNRDVWSRSYDS